LQVQKVAKKKKLQVLPVHYIIFITLLHNGRLKRAFLCASVLDKKMIRRFHFR